MLTEIQMVVHPGTHVDAPRHFFSDGPAFHEIPLDRLHGRGVVWRIEKEDYGVIDVADLERARPRLSPGDILALDTGWARHLARRVTTVILVSALPPRGGSFHSASSCLRVTRLLRPRCEQARKRISWPVHHVLLGHGGLVSEHLTNLATLADGHAEFMFLALNVQDSDGSPARVLARKVD